MTQANTVEVGNLWIGRRLRLDRAIGMVGVHTFALFRRVTGLKAPERCKLCGTAGIVVPETIIAGGLVLLKWFCRACGDEWPMSKAEQRLVEQKEININHRRTRRRKKQRAAKRIH